MTLNLSPHPFGPALLRDQTYAPKHGVTKYLVFWNSLDPVVVLQTSFFANITEEDRASFTKVKGDQGPVMGVTCTHAYITDNEGITGVTCVTMVPRL